MADFSVSTSLRLMRQTAPFVGFRVLVHFAIAVAYVLATGVGWSVGALGAADFRA